MSCSRRWVGDGPSDSARGLDIGTGASAIYPLLACSLDSTWSMLATELDDTSFAYAKANVEDNDLHTRIRVHKVKDPARTFEPLYLEPSEQLDFSMCNPPFYSSKAEVETSQAGKEELPSQACTGGELEMIYAGNPSSEEDWEREGGEVAFVGRMVMESVHLRHRCRWYTSMLGKLSSVPKLVDLLRSQGITNYIITEFIQGRTRRWALGWSFEMWRVSDTAGRLSHLPVSHPLYKVQPPRTTLSYSIPLTTPIKAVEETLMSLAEDNRFSYSRLPTSALSDKQGDIYLVKATTGVWSRAARRKRKREINDVEESQPPPKRRKSTTPSTSTPSTSEGVDATGSSIERWLMISTVRLTKQDTGSKEEGTRLLECQWVYGQDRALFESFASHLSKRACTAD